MLCQLVVRSCLAVLRKAAGKREPAAVRATTDGPGTSCGHLGPSAAFSGLLRSPGASRGLSEPSRGFRGPSAASWGLSRPPGASCGPRGISWGLLEPLAVFRGSVRYRRIKESRGAGVSLSRCSGCDSVIPFRASFRWMSVWTKILGFGELAAGVVTDFFSNTGALSMGSRPRVPVRACGCRRGHRDHSVFARTPNFAHCKADKFFACDGDIQG